MNTEIEIKAKAFDLLQDKLDFVVRDFSQSSDNKCLVIDSNLGQLHVSEDEFTLIKSALSESTIDESAASGLSGSWEISWDGWYPYCSICSFEPQEFIWQHKGRLPEFCPRCKAKMLNYSEFSEID